ncbi:uncharacterized protein LOC128392859 [Panonychus citri]|uniref:uncharacterized protein LOC128392859 n=1 Tax=Panonychus citri TaxID=50023 RepID=UPI0023082D6F|nr:uncharacterized protein LOC128392859 [Panonychus citri]
MNVLLIITFISAIGAASIGNAQQQISHEGIAYIQYAVYLVEHLEGWVFDGSLESNVIRQYDRQFAAGYAPEWDFKLSNEENLKNCAARTFNKHYLNLSWSVYENIYAGIEILTRMVNLEKEKVLGATRTIIDVINLLDIPDLDVNKSLKTNIDSFVAHGVAGIEASSEPDFTRSPVQAIVEDFVTSALKLVRFKGYSTNATLHANVNNLLNELERNVKNESDAKLSD